MASSTTGVGSGPQVFMDIRIGDRKGSMLLDFDAKQSHNSLVKICFLPLFSTCSVGVWHGVGGGVVGGRLGGREVPRTPGERRSIFGRVESATC